MLSGTEHKQCSKRSCVVGPCAACRALIKAELFEEAASRRGPLPTGEPVWQEVRGRLAAGQGSRKALAEECPSSSIGALLAMLLQQVNLLLPPAFEVMSAIGIQTCRTCEMQLV